jgi:hypothetical protein
MLRTWARHAKNISNTGRKVIHICEPEVGESLSDEEGRSITRLINCQEGINEFSNFQVGNDMRSSEDLLVCQEDSNENSYFQVGNEMGS